MAISRHSHNITYSKVIITGGTGFIGSHLAERLALKHQLILVDRTSNLRNIKSIKSLVKTINLDVSSRAFTDLLVKTKPDFIFHFAGTAHPEDSVSDPKSDLKSNLLSTFNILNTIRSFKKKPKLIIASSVGVYGSSNDRVLSETTTLPLPLSPYGTSKLAAEHYSRVFANLYHVPTISVRLFSTYGPRLTKQVVFDLINKLNHNQNQLQIIGDGSQKRDLTYISDQIDNILKLSVTAPFCGETINLGSGTGVSIQKLVSSITNIMKVNPRIVYSGKIRQVDGNNWVADTSKMHKLGCNTSINLRSGLNDTIDWYKNEYSP